MKDVISKYQKISKKTHKTKKADEESVRVTLSQEVLEELLLEDENEVEEQLTIKADREFEYEEVAETPAPVVKEKKAKEIYRGNGDFKGTRDEMIREYAPLIKYIAQKIAARLPANIELDDLISAGVIGLMDAIEKYDPTRDNKFKTYAEFRIRGAILDELRSQDWVPRSVREKSKALERVYVKIENEKGRAATEDEVCQELNCSKEELYDMLNQVRSVSLLSYEDLNAFSKNDRRAALGLSDNDRTSNPFAEVNSANLKKMIADAIKDLPEKQRLVLSLYYYEDLNLKEIGKVLEVTESRVSQLHTQAVIRIKAKLKNHFDDFLAFFA